MTKNVLVVVGAALLFATGCANTSAADTQQEVIVEAKTGTVRENFFALQSVLWKNPGNIPVCWNDAGFTSEKGWVQDALKKSWEASDAAIKFTGFGPCVTGQAGIHIAVRSGDPDGPHTVDFGEAISGKDESMILDFEFTDGTFDKCRESETMRERCVRAIATHEFGHALGFLHEQERSDTPSSCEFADPQPADPDTKSIGKWDLMSIMNYCFPDRENVFPTSLSPLDIAGLVQMYPPPKVAAQTPPPPSTDTTSTKTQSTGDVDEKGTGDDDDDDATSSTTPGSKKKKTSSTKKKSSAAPAVSNGCSAVPGQASSGAATWLFAVGLVFLARKRQKRAR